MTWGGKRRVPERRDERTLVGGELGGFVVSEGVALHPTPHTLGTTPCTLQHAPYTLHPTLYALHLLYYLREATRARWSEVSCAALLSPKVLPYTIHSRPHTLHPTPCTLQHASYTPHPILYALHPTLLPE